MNKKFNFRYCFGVSLCAKIKKRVPFSPISPPPPKGFFFKGYAKEKGKKEKYVCIGLLFKLRHVCICSVCTCTYIHT